MASPFLVSSSCFACIRSKLQGAASLWTSTRLKRWSRSKWSAMCVCVSWKGMTCESCSCVASAIPESSSERNFVGLKLRYRRPHSRNCQELAVPGILKVVWHRRRDVGGVPPQKQKWLLRQLGFCLWLAQCLEWRSHKRFQKLLKGWNIYIPKWPKWITGVCKHRFGIQCDGP